MRVVEAKVKADFERVVIEVVEGPPYQCELLKILVVDLGVHLRGLRSFFVFEDLTGRMAVGSSASDAMSGKIPLVVPSVVSFPELAENRALAVLADLGELIL